MSKRAKKAAMVLLVTVALGACASPPSPGGPSPSPGGAGPGEAVPRPGLEKQSDGTAIGRGWVTKNDLEGGFWTLTDVAPGAGTAGAAVVVLLSGRATEADIAALEGSYVSASGRVASGVSTRMSGPEMKVDTIEKLAPNRR